MREIKTPSEKVLEYIVSNNGRQMPTYRKIATKLRMHHQTVINAVRKINEQWIFTLVEWVITVQKELVWLRKVVWLFVVPRNSTNVWFIAIDDSGNRYEIEWRNNDWGINVIWHKL